MSDALSNAVVQLNLERTAVRLAGSVDLKEIRGIRNKAQAISAYMRAHKAGIQMENDAAEIVLRADRRLGELCAKTTGGKAGGGRRSKGGPGATNKSNSVSLLSELGVTGAESSRWQKLAAIDKKEFDGYVREKRKAEERLTASGTLRELRPRPAPKPVWVYEIELVKADNAIDALVNNWPIDHLDDLMVAFQKALRDIKRKRGK